MSSALITRIDQLLDQLAQAEDLGPGPQNDQTFSELVGLSLEVRGAEAQEVLQGLGTKVEQLRSLCSAGESALEQHWSARIAVAEDPRAALEQFPYTENYRELTLMEVSAVRGVGVSARNVAMIGSGPLPLTGMFLAEEHGAEVTLIDCDVSCLQAGDRLLDSLGAGERFRSMRAQVPEDDVDLSGFDTVLLAAMVGSDGAQKRDVLERIAARMRPGACLMVRSATGLRELLYPPVDLDGVAGIRPLMEVHPRHEVVNSVILAEVLDGTV